MRLCVSLRKHSGFEVFFCSDDVNARTRAEIESLATFSFKDIAQSVGENPEELSKLANDVIEQWQSQITGTAEEDEIVDKMEEDDEAIGRTGSTTHHLNQHSSSNNNTCKASLSKAKACNTGNTTQHSIYAVSSPSTRTTRSMAASRSTPNPHLSNSRDIRAKQHITHQYPKDKSTASSMWAV